MNIDKFLNTVKYLNFLIENVTSDDVDSVKGSIKRTKEKMDILNARIQSRLMYDEDAETLPFTKVIINFLDDVTLNVRAAVQKAEHNFYGKQKFNLLSITDEYMILQQDTWDYRVGVVLYYNNLNLGISQRGDIQLFYNEYGFISSGEKTRSSLRELISFEIREKK
jgi:hypothetical protein